MPILPLDHPEPFTATLGVMLYPGTDDLEKRKAAAFQIYWLAEPIRRLNADSHHLSQNTLLHLALHAGEQLEDLDQRWWQGTATGELLKVLFALYNTNPALASWNNAIRLAERVAVCARAAGSRSAQFDARRRYLPVAHLWAAWCIREAKFETRPKARYEGYADFQSFLAESEIIRHWGQTWLPARRDSTPLLPPDLWHVGEGWRPLKRECGWPDTGQIPVLKIADDLLAGLRPAGRPRRGA
jgi:hypothetical protein